MKYKTGDLVYWKGALVHGFGRVNLDSDVHGHDFEVVFIDGCYEPVDFGPVVLLNERDIKSTNLRHAERAEVWRHQLIMEKARVLELEQENKKLIKRIASMMRDDMNMRQELLEARAAARRADIIANLAVIEARCLRGAIELDERDALLQILDAQASRHAQVEVEYETRIRELVKERNRALDGMLQARDKLREFTGSFLAEI